jgi:glyoxylase I family protein
MIRIAGIDHVVLRVSNLERMLRFYAEVLGVQIEKSQEAIGLWQLRAGDALIDMVTIDGPLGRARGAASGREGPNVDHICLRVRPWDSPAIIEHLRGHGIEAEIVTRYGADGDGPSIYLSDPEGNALELKGPPWPSTSHHT